MSLESLSASFSAVITPKSEQLVYSQQMISPSPFAPTMGGEGTACFVSGTMVTMADGTQKPIETIQIGERVAGRTGCNTVVALHTPKLADRMLSTVDGKVRTTADHIACIDKGWAAISPFEYARRDYKKPLKMTNGEVTEFTGPRPDTVTDYGIGTRMAFGQNGYKKIETLTSEKLSPDTQLYTLVLDGDGMVQLEGGYVFLACGFVGMKSHLIDKQAA